MIRIDLEKYRKDNYAKRKENNNFYHRLSKLKTKDLDQRFHALHDEVFSEVDCLTCANCCKTTGPRFLRTDINRISKYLGMKAAQFETDFLERDEADDWVLQKTPCHFLEENNECSIYDIRPKACQEFPHTDRIKINQILDLTRQNNDVCPAVSEMTERLKTQLK